MKLIQETDIFKYMNGGEDAVINKKMSDLVATGMKPVVNELDYNLRTIDKTFKDPLTSAMLDEVTKGTIIPFIVYDPKEAMPTYMPFIKYMAKGGAMTVGVDITQVASIRNDIVNEDLDIKINNAKLYTLLATAYIYQKFGDKRTTLTPAMNALTAGVWAKMFVNPFDRELGLQTNRDRYEAFIYFAQKFYLRNILELPPAIEESISINVFRNKKKTPFAAEMEAMITDRGIDIYKDITTFVTTMLNADITGLNQSRANIKNANLGFQWYMSKFIATFGVNAGFAIATFPYFMWTLFSANNSAWMFTGDRIMESISKTEFPKIMNEIYRMIRN